MNDTPSKLQMIAGSPSTVLLALLTNQKEPKTMQQIAALTRYTHKTTKRGLERLLKQGLIEQTPDQRYKCSPALWS